MLLKLTSRIGLYAILSLILFAVPFLGLNILQAKPAIATTNDHHVAKPSSPLIPIPNEVEGYSKEGSSIPASQAPIFTEGFNYTSTSQLTSTGWVLTITGSGSSVTFPTSSPLPHEGSRYLKLTNDGNDTITLERTFSPALSNVMVTFWYYDPGGYGGFVVGVHNSTTSQLVWMGVRTNTNPNDYHYRTKWVGDTNPLLNGIPTYHPRSINTGWHRFDLVITQKGTYGRIDTADPNKSLINLSYLPSANGQTAVNTSLTSANKISIVSTWGQGQIMSAYFDDVQITPLPAIGSLLDIEYRFLETYNTQFEQNINYNAITDNALHTQPWRLFSNNALVHSLRYQKFGNSQDLVTTKEFLKRDLQYLNVHTDTTNGRQDWGNGVYSFWTAPLTDYSLALASWLSWNVLTPTLRSDIHNELSQEADYWACQVPQNRNGEPPPSNDNKGDTAAEENAWTSQFLAIMSKMFSTDPRAEYWEKKAKQFAFHSLTTGQSYDGITTQTLYNSPQSQLYYMENHNILPNPTYACATIGILGEAALAYKLAGQPIPSGIPSQFKNNVYNVYNAHAFTINQTNWLFQNTTFPAIYGGKDDHNTDATGQCLNAFTYLGVLSPTYQFLRNNLITYEGHVQRDLVTWPKDARIYMPGWEDPPVFPYPEASYNQKWFYNSGKAARHAINILWHDPAISVVPTSPTFQPPTHFLENFDQYTNVNQMPVNTWTLTITGSGSTVGFSTAITHSGQKSLIISNDGNDTITLVRPFSPALSNAIVTFWYYDPGGNGGFYVGVQNSTASDLVMMGVRTPTFPSHYFYRTDASIGTATSRPRAVGWHKFDLVITPQGTYGRIDCVDLSSPNELGQAAINPALTSVSKIFIASTWAQVGNAYIDDIQIRPFKTGLSTLWEDSGSDTYMPVIIK